MVYPTVCPQNLSPRGKKKKKNRFALYTDRCVWASWIVLEIQEQLDLFGEHDNIKITMILGSTFEFVYTKQIHPKFEKNETEANE